MDVERRGGDEDGGGSGGLVVPVEEERRFEARPGERRQNRPVRASTF